MKDNKEEQAERYCIPAECWQSIDEMPIWNWDRCLETQDYRYALKLLSYTNLPETKIDCQRAFEELVEEKNQVFGMSNQQTDLFYKRKRLALLTATFFIVDGYLEKMQYVTPKGVHWDKYMTKVKEWGVKDTKYTEEKWLEWIDVERQRNTEKLNRIKLLRTDIENITNSNKKSGMTLHKQAAHMQRKFPGVDFNVKTMSVSRWFSFVEIYNEDTQR